MWSPYRITNLDLLLDNLQKGCNELKAEENVVFHIIYLSVLGTCFTEIFMKIEKSVYLYTVYVVYVYEGGPKIQNL